VAAVKHRAAGRPAAHRDREAWRHSEHRPGGTSGEAVTAPDTTKPWDCVSNCTRFIARAYALRSTGWRMLSTGANGQPAVAAYVRGADGMYGLYTLDVFTVRL
jgi:hypothetical protein